MTRYGILIDYEYCTGCRSCEMACRVEYDFPQGRNGIVVNEIGPWQIEGDRWQYDYLPALTDECTLCAARVEKGKQPTCVQHCQAAVMTYGSVSELSAKLDDKGKQVLIVK